MGMKNVQDENRRRKLAVVELALQSGILDRVSRLLSATYLLHVESLTLVDDAEELLKDHGLMVGRLITLSKKLNIAYNDFFEEFGKLIPREKIEQWEADYSKFDEMFRAFAELDDEFKPNVENIDVVAIEKKYNVKLKIKQ